MAMSAMEKMVANMLGISPEEMHSMLSGFSTLATTLKEQLDRMEKNQIAMMGHLTALEMMIGNHDDDGSKRHGGDGERGGGTDANSGGRSEPGSPGNG